MRVLISESPSGAGSAISGSLSANPAFLVHIVSTTDEGLEQLINRGFDAGIVVAPFQPGRSCIMRVRHRCESLPILVVAPAADRSKLVPLIEAGADDCLAPTWEAGELCSRIIALVRRSRGYASSCIEIGDFKLDLSEGRLLRSTISIALSGRGISTD
jgi:DNA-binding response OmpR family regulator